MPLPRFLHVVQRFTNRLVVPLWRPYVACDRTTKPFVRIGRRRLSSTLMPAQFTPKKILILSKLTRFEYEKRLRPSLSEAELRKFLVDRGSDYEFLRKMHDTHHEMVDHMRSFLESRDIEVRIVERFEYTETLIGWADAIVTAGGDGTFLMGASKIKSLAKPLIGINTDLVRSEGYLCLPKYYSQNFAEAFKRILSGQFSWMFRQRIRITMSGKHANDPGIELLDEQLHTPEYRFTEHVREHEETNQSSHELKHQPDRVLPVLALNEVFIGEALSSRVSYYEISIDDSAREKQKSSGITVSTGTGSSSWFFHINHLHKSNIGELMKIINSLCGTKLDVNSEVLLRRITEHYNNSLTFESSAPHMAFTVRDPVVNGIFQVSNPRGFANKICVKSRMWDSRLVVDGGVSFTFNDGAIATMHICPDDALRTIKLDDVSIEGVSELT